MCRFNCELNLSSQVCGTRVHCRTLCVDSTDLFASFLCVSIQLTLAQVFQHPSVPVFRVVGTSGWSVPCVSVSIQGVDSTYPFARSHEVEHSTDPFTQVSTPFRRPSVCSSCSPKAGHGGQVVVARGHGEATNANCRLRADRCTCTCSVAGMRMGVGGRILEILAGVLVHRATRPR